MITVEDLKKLTEYLPGLELFTKWTPMKWDDAIVKVLETIASDEDMLKMLADWLNYLPIFKGAAEAGFQKKPEPALPECCEAHRPELEAWREYIYHNKITA